MNEREVKARLAQAEVHYSHYRWDDAIACFEAVLAAHPDHPMATQGWSNAIEQKNIDEELQQTLGKVRANLTAHRFEEALSALNLAQSRGALSQILKYHAEIDGLRSEAQEGQEWQRRVEAVTRETEALAGRLRFDQALEALDTLLHQLGARGWERLGTGLAALRDRLWAERDVSERVQFARSTFEHQDYRLAAVGRFPRSFLAEDARHP
jgi:tetratricopeptide (TPR) repeat protein